MKWLLQPKATKLIGNVWAGFDSIFGAFFISYFDSKKWDLAAESYFIYSPFLFMHALVPWYCGVLYFTLKLKAKNF